MASFGKKVRECWDTKGISQNELAKLIEAHHSIIGKYERDEASPSIEAAKKIADTLGVTLDALVGDGINAAFDKITPVNFISLNIKPIAEIH